MARKIDALPQRQAQVFRAFVDHGALSRQELSEALQLGRSSLIAPIDELLRAGWITRARHRPNGAGRPSELLEVDALRTRFVGVSFDADQLSVGLMSLHGGTDEQATAPVDPTAPFCHALESIRRLTHSLRASAAADRPPPIAVVAAAPTPLSGDHRAVGNHLHPSWLGRSLSDALTGCVGAPALVENDADVLARGAASGAGATIALVVGHGVGAGTVIGGSLVRGRFRSAGEIGHVQLAESASDILCGCGRRGCLATLATLPMIAPDHRAGADRREVVGRAHRAGSVLADVVAASVALLDVGQIVVQCSDDLVRRSVTESLQDRLDALDGTGGAGTVVRPAEGTDVLRGLRAVLLSRILGD